MSLLEILSIDEDQLDIVIDAVKDWCEHQHVSVDDERGKLAMAIAVRQVKQSKLSRKELEDVLRREVGT